VTAGHRIHTVDVFAEKPLAGNQLAVVLDAEDIPGEVMQRIAKEMNISETTFVLPARDPANAARVRIFTPASELPFAGHPTVGTAWVLSTEGLVPGGSLEFILEEEVGPVPVRGVKGAGGLNFWMRHPALSYGAVERRRAQAADAIGLTEADLLAEVPVQVASTGNPFLFFGLRDAGAVDDAAPDLESLTEVLEATHAFGAFVFAPVGGSRLYSRMFARDMPEDPATGSGAGPLGAFAV
jgi:trans-2,3-dihydro-3-hydroxyanthranilate isomerase